MLNSLKQWFKILALLVALVACGLQEPAPTTEEAVDPKAVATNGLTGVYYDNLDFTGITKTRVDATINSSWQKAAPITGIAATTYSVRWTGQIMPAFSQTYTFYLTSSDGARLMVNGQVLVNDWVDGVSRVQSGTLALTANTKYDIRLEYYRNATNAGAVKLEWQSTSRARQVVPTGNLFPTGSNLQDYITKANNSTLLQTKGLTLDSKNAVGNLDAGKFIISASSNTFTQNYTLIMSNDQIIYATAVDYSNNRIMYENMRSGKKVDITGILTSIGDVSNLTTIQTQQLAALLYTVLENQGFSSYSTNTTIRLKILGDGTIPLPGSLCAACSTEWSNYNLQFTFFVGMTYATIKAGQKTYKSFKDTGKAGDDWGAITPLGGMLGAYNLYILAYNAYLECIRTKCRGSLDKPLELKGRGKVNELISISFSIKNITPSSYPISWDISTDIGYFWSLGPTSGKLFSPDSSLQSEQLLYLYVQCPAVAQILKGTVTLHDDGNSAGTITTTLIPVTVDCIDSPKLFANPLALATKINTAVSGNIVLESQGQDILELTGVSGITITQPLEGASLARTDLVSVGLINPGSSYPLGIIGYCGSTVGKLEGTIVISSNATNAPTLSVGVTLECIDNATKLGNSFIGGLIGGGSNCGKPDNIPPVRGKAYFSGSYYAIIDRVYLNVPSPDSTYKSILVMDFGIVPGAGVIEDGCLTTTYYGEFPKLRAKILELQDAVQQQWLANAKPNLSLRNITYLNTGGFQADVYQAN
jgi:hypothetical protein